MNVMSNLHETKHGIRIGRIETMHEDEHLCGYSSS